MNRSLIVAYDNVSSLFLVHSKEEPPSGVEGLLFTMIMEALGMSYILVPQNLFKLERRNKVLKKLILSGKVDVEVSSQIISDSARQCVEFTIPYFYSDINFATDFPQMKPKMYSYLYAFDRTTWVLIATVSVVVPIAFGVLFKVGGFSKIWLNMFGNFLGRSVEQRMHGPSQTIFMMAWWFGTMVLFFSYSGVVLSCLSVPAMDAPPKNFKELSKAIQRGEYTALFKKGKYVEFVLNRSQNADVVYIRDTMLKNGWFYQRGFPHEKIFKPRTAYIGSSFLIKLQFGVEPYASKYMSEGISPFYMGMTLNKRDYKLKKRLDAIISRIIQGGLVAKIMDNHFFKIWMSSSPHQEAESQVSSLSLKDVIGAFVILASGLCASTAVFIIEIVSHKVRKAE